MNKNTEPPLNQTVALRCVTLFQPNLSRSHLKLPIILQTVAQTGLDWCHENFQFVEPGTGKVTSLKEANPNPNLTLSPNWKVTSLKQQMDSNKATFETGVIKGEAKKPKGDFELVVPYNGKMLKGDELLVQIEKWQRKDVIEASCAAAMIQVVKTRKWLDLSDKHVVLLGAGSAMGPLLVLLALGANVIAVDICPKAFRPEGTPPNPKRPGPWEGPMPGGRDGLILATKKTCGSLTFPLPVGRKQKDMSMEDIYDEAGCNLLTQPAEIKNWLMSLYPDKQLTIGAYAYLDGDRFVDGRRDGGGGQGCHCTEVGGGW